MGILEEINSLVKIAAAMPQQNPVVPGIGAPPQVGRTVPPVAPPEVKTPALPVPPQHKSELPEAGDSKKVDWLMGVTPEENARKAWFRRAAERIEKKQVEERRSENIDPYHILYRRFRRWRRNPGDEREALQY